jgi:peptidoglycan LD-endopeptidase CwlK
MINSRDIDDLTPDARAMFYRWVAHCQRQGLTWQYDYIVTSTYRDQAYQDYLYGQGRTYPGPVVTWTHNSRHTDRVAWDVALKKGKIILWDVAKTDVDNDQIPDYLELADVGRELGLKVGADLPKPDYCHFEVGR